MQLTLANLIKFLKSLNYPGFEDLQVNTSFRESSIDGDDAVDLLLMIQDEFKIDFEKFEFRKYFLEEIEISRSLSWFGLKKLRKIEEELTVEKLFWIMYKLQLDNNATC